MTEFTVHSDQSHRAQSQKPQDTGGEGVKHRGEPLRRMGEPRMRRVPYAIRKDEAACRLVTRPKRHIRLT